MSAVPEYKMGDKAICKMCDHEIVFIGPYWDHVGEWKPRHPGLPKIKIDGTIIDNITIEHLGIKEIDALLLDRWQKQSAPPQEIQVSERTLNWFIAQLSDHALMDKSKTDKITEYVNKYAPPYKTIVVTLNNDLPFRTVKVIDA